MESVSTEQPPRSVLAVQCIRAAAIGVLANSALCLWLPALTTPRNWFPNIAFAVLTVHLMGWVFRKFITQARVVSANTLGFAMALLIPLCYLSPAL